MEKVLHKDDKLIPILICDHCGERIEDAGNANCLLEEDRPYPDDGETTDVYHVHKGECDRALSAELSEGGAGHSELETHLWRLCHNSGLPSDRIKEVEDRDAILGNL